MNQPIFWLGVAFGFVLGLVATLGLFLLFALVAPWLRALTSGSRVRMMQIVGMRLRGNPPGFLIDAYRALVHSGRDVNIREIESWYIAKKHTFPEKNMKAFLEVVEEELQTR